MDALRTVSTGLENAQNMQNVRAAQGIEALRERNDKEPAQPERVAPSVQVNLSEEARAAARSGAASPPPPAPASTPAAPVQMREAVVRAESTGNISRVEMQNAAASGRDAVQRYMENAGNQLPPGQSAPSSVRVSA
ncbi:MAG: hypothetical protein FWF12_12850 [Betaproteobacteria bacterium]|nr:hypothetical protein [Betaproteobacteria bacterium]